MSKMLYLTEEESSAVSVCLMWCADLSLLIGLDIWTINLIKIRCFCYF